MKHAGIAVFIVVALATASWGANQAPKKYHSAAPPQHHSSAKAKETGQARASASAEASQAKSQSARERELGRLEHQNAMQLQAQTRHSSKAAGQATRVHPQPSGHGSGINFSYHPPHTQSTTTPGRKH